MANTKGFDRLVDAFTKNVPDALASMGNYVKGKFSGTGDAAGNVAGGVVGGVKSVARGTGKVADGALGMVGTVVGKTADSAAKHPLIATALTVAVLWKPVKKFWANHIAKKDNRALDTSNDIAALTYANRQKAAMLSAEYGATNPTGNWRGQVASSRGQALPPGPN